MATATASPKPRTFFSLFWRRLRRHKMAMASLVVIVLLVLMALFAPWIAPYDPTAQPTGEDVGAYYFLPLLPNTPWARTTWGGTCFPGSSTAPGSPSSWGSPWPCPA